MAQSDEVMEVLFEPLLVPGSLPKVMSELAKLTNAKHVLSLELNAATILQGLSSIGAGVNQQVSAIQRDIRKSLQGLTKEMSVQQMFQSQPSLAAAIKTEFLTKQKLSNDPGVNRSLKSQLSKLLEHEVSEFVTATAIAAGSGVDSAIQKMRASGGIDQRFNANLKAGRDALGKQLSQTYSLASKAIYDFGKDIGADKQPLIELGNQDATRKSLKNCLSKIAKGADARLRLVADVMNVATNEAQAELAGQFASKQPAVRDQAAAQMPGLVLSKFKEIAGSKLQSLTGGKDNLESLSHAAYAFGNASAQRQHLLAQDRLAQEEILRQYQRQQFDRYKKDMRMPSHTAFQLANESVHFAASAEGLDPGLVKSALSGSDLSRGYNAHVLKQEARKEEQSKLRDARSQAAFAAKLLKEGNVAAAESLVKQARDELSGDSLQAFENKYKIETAPKSVGDSKARQQFVSQLKANANSVGASLASRYSHKDIASAIEAAGTATIALLQNQGMTLAEAKAAVDRLSPEMHRVQRGLVKESRARLSPFSKTEIRDRFQSGIDNQGLMGADREAQAVLIRNALLAELDAAIPASSRSDQESSQLYRKLRNRVVQSSSDYTGGRNALEEERQARAQEMYQRFYGKPGSDDLAEDREALRRAGLASKANLASLRMQASTTSDPDVLERINRELQIAYNHDQAIVRAESQITALRKEQLVLESALTHAQNKAGLNPGIFATGNIQKAKDALDRNKQAQRVLLGGQKGTIDRDYNSAILQASYGVQDFFQMTAQPGMGPVRGLLAAANNLGPAMAMLRISSVPANLAIATLLAGMTALNVSMDKDEEKLRSMKQTVDDMSDSFRRSYDNVVKLQSGLDSIGFGAGRGASEAQAKVFGSPLTAHPMNYLLESSRSSSLNALTQNLGPGFIQGTDYNPFDAAKKLGQMIFSPIMTIWEASSSQRDLNLPLSETEKMFPKIGNYAEFRKSLSAEDSKSLHGGILDQYKEHLGVNRFKYYETAERLSAQDKFMEDSGAKAKFMQSLRSIQEDMDLLREIRASVSGSEERVVRGAALASEFSARDPGAKEAYAKSIFENISASRSQAEFAANQLSLAEKSYPAEIAMKTKELEELKKRRENPESDSDILLLDNEIAQVTRSLTLLTNQFEKIKESAKTSADLAQQAPKDFESLARTPGFGRAAAKQLIPGLDQGGLLAADASIEAVANGIIAFGKLAPAMRDTEKQFFSARAAVLQFGSAFAQQVAKIENLESELAIFQATNFGMRAAERGRQFGLSVGLEAGQALGFELKPEGRQQQLLFEQAARMRDFIIGLERRGMIESGMAGSLRAGVQAESARRHMDFTSGDQLLQKVQAANEFAIAVMNLGKAIEHGAALARQGGLMTEVQGAWAAANAQLKAAGFNASGLADDLKKLSENEDLLIAQIEGSGLDDGQKNWLIELVRSQSAAKKELAMWNSSMGQSQRASRGGYIDDRTYRGADGVEKTGRQKNFDDAVLGLREERDRKLAEARGMRVNDPSGAAALSKLADEEFRKRLGQEIDKMLPKGQGKVSVEGIESFHKSIQESLVSDPATRLQEEEVAILEDIRALLEGKKSEQEMSQESQERWNGYQKPPDKLDPGEANPNHPGLAGIQAAKEAGEADAENKAAKSAVVAAEANREKVAKWRRAHEQNKIDEFAVSQLDVEAESISFDQKRLAQIEHRRASGDPFSSEDFEYLTSIGMRVSESGNVNPGEYERTVRNQEKILDERKKENEAAKKEAEDRAKRSKSRLIETAPFGAGSMSSDELAESLGQAEREASDSLRSAKKRSEEAQIRADEARKKKEAEDRKSDPGMTLYRGDLSGDFSIPESSAASALAANVAIGKLEVSLDKIGTIFEEKLTKQLELWEEIQRDGIPQRIA